MTRGRQWKSRLAVGLCIAAVIVALVPLLLILTYVVQRGAAAMSWSFLTEMPKPVGEAGGGMANAIAGSLLVIGVAALFAVPAGIAAGIYLAEFRDPLANVVRFAADVLNGVPSIVIGIFAYAVVVLPLRHFSALAGSFALGVMMIPIVVRTTEELLRLVPQSLRDGALALGATHARATFTVVVPAALPGIITGVLLAIARIAGETAPLLFTAFNNRFFTADVRQPISTLTVQVFTYAISPYEEWHQQAWAGALLLITLILVCSFAARLATRRLERMTRT
jgi:phosphate transport system permease protein